MAQHDVALIIDLAPQPIPFTLPVTAPPRVEAIEDAWITDELERRVNTARPIFTATTLDALCVLAHKCGWRRA